MLLNKDKALIRFYQLPPTDHSIQYTVSNEHVAESVCASPKLTLAKRQMQVKSGFIESAGNIFFRKCMVYL